MENVDIIGKLNDLASRIDAKEGINNKYFIYILQKIIM